MIRTTKMRRVLRHFRLRKKISGTAARPRMCVSFTANNMYVQFIDDEAGRTLAAVSTLSPWKLPLHLVNLPVKKLLQPLSQPWYSTAAVFNIMAV